jgi:hypothetical protein
MSSAIVQPQATAAIVTETKATVKTGYAFAPKPGPKKFTMCEYRCPLTPTGNGDKLTGTVDIVLSRGETLSNFMVGLRYVTNTPPLTQPAIEWITLFADGIVNDRHIPATTNILWYGQETIIIPFKAVHFDSTVQTDSTEPIHVRLTLQMSNQYAVAGNVLRWVMYRS